MRSECQVSKLTTSHCTRSVSYTHLDVYKRQGVCYVISRSGCQVAFLNDRKLSSAYKKYEKRGQLLEEILTVSYTHLWANASIRSFRSRLTVRKKQMKIQD